MSLDDDIITRGRFRENFCVSEKPCLLPPPEVPQKAPQTRFCSGDRLGATKKNCSPLARPALTLLAAVRLDSFANVFLVSRLRLRSLHVCQSQTGNRLVREETDASEDQSGSGAVTFGGCQRWDDIMTVGPRQEAASLLLVETPP